MEKQILDMLIKMDEGLGKIEETQNKLITEVAEVKVTVNRIESKIEGIGYQFEETAKNKIVSITEIEKRLEHVESDLYRIKRQ